MFSIYIPLELTNKKRYFNQISKQNRNFPKIKKNTEKSKIWAKLQILVKNYVFKTSFHDTIGAQERLAI